MLVQNTQIDTTQLNDIVQLREQCGRVDNHQIPIYAHILQQERALPLNVLYYQQQELIGFLSVFFFYDKACEISVMVAPNQRQKGIATKLLAQVLPVIKTLSYKHLIFPAPHSTRPNWLSSHAMQYLHSEFEMKCLGSEKIQPMRNELTIKAAMEKDIDVLCAIDKACFDNDEALMRTRFLSLLNDKSHQIYLAYIGTNTIGKAHLRQLSHELHLSDVAIWPTHQGQGFGQSLMANCINEAIKAGFYEIHLNVEAQNEHAIRLYTKLGFQPFNVCDYWQMDVV